MNTNDTGELIIALSIDICGSTDFKRNCEMGIWRNVVYRFHDSPFRPIYRRIQDVYPKRIGDEVVFFVKVDDVIDICDIIKRTYKAVLDLHKDFHEDFKNKCTRDIFFKATMWISLVHMYDEKEKIHGVNPKNIVIKLKDKSNDNVEYLGIHIDEGFRLATWSRPNLLIIDPKIVHILLTAREMIRKNPTGVSSVYNDAPQQFVDDIAFFIEKSKNSSEILTEFNESVEHIFSYGDVKLKDIDCKYPLLGYYDTEYSNEIAGITHAEIEEFRHEGTQPMMDEIAEYFSRKEEENDLRGILDILRFDVFRDTDTF